MRPGRRGEAVDLLECDPAAVEASEHDPAALGTKVDGDYRSGGHDPTGVLAPTSNPARPRMSRDDLPTSTS